VPTHPSQPAAASNRATNVCSAQATSCCVPHLLMLVPPYTTQVLKGWKRSSASASLAIWEASSRVGEMTSTEMPPPGRGGDLQGS
jgi:hypothetical protein